MTQRSAFQIQILEKLGAPLLRAVSEVSARQGGADGQKQEAERVAELLNKAIQVSIGLASSMDVKAADNDSIRLALAAVAGPLVAGQYRATGNVPDAGDLKRMIKALEAVLVFSDSFAPAADNTLRLENIAPGAAPADEEQVSVQYVTALVPVIGAVASFSFGQVESKLVQEVADRLVATAGRIGRTLLNGSADEQARKRAELQILKALADIYAECHEAETARLLQMDDTARARTAEQAGDGLSMEPVWRAFDRRAGMIEMLGKGAGPEIETQDGQMPDASSPPIRQPIEQSFPPPQETVSQERYQVDGSPLSMFAKKPAAAQSAPPQAPSGQPPMEAPPQADGDDVPPGVDSNGDAGSYNPMSFFKPGDDDHVSGDQEDH